MQKKQVPDTLSLVEKVKREHEGMLEGYSKELAAADVTQSSTINDLTKALQLYRSRLGMTFVRKEEDELQVVFHLIDPLKPEREFKFNVLLTPDDKYTGMYWLP